MAKCILKTDRNIFSRIYFIENSINLMNSRGVLNE